MAEPLQRDDPTAGSSTDHPQDVIALCLSGGGYRAMLFHVGALWRLDQAGLLRRLALVSSVSGGSIANGWLALAWTALTAPGADFAKILVAPLRKMASTSVGYGTIALGLITGSVNKRVAATYDDTLFGGRTLQDLPDAPLFIFTAANLQTGALWHFAKESMGDYKVGRIMAPEVSIARAVAASSAFPPLLSPAIFEPDASRFVPRDPAQAFADPKYRSRVVLADGGVYDNLGLEPVIKRARCVLVSDGGAPFATKPAPGIGWVSQTLRVLFCEDHQVRALRKRDLIDRYQLNTDLQAAGIDPKSERSFRALARAGTYWGITTHVADYPVKGGLPCPPEKTERLAHLPTTLIAMTDADQERLINWGYAVTDAAIRAHVDPTIAPATQWPYARGLD